MNAEVIYGIGVGYNYAIALKKEAELKQGENDYQASLYQIQELSSFTSVASNILSKIPYAPLQIGAAIGNNLIPLAGIFLMPTAAVIKNGHYEQGVHCFDSLVEKKYPRLKGILPEKIEESGVNLFSYLADNTNKITSVGLAVGTLALPFLGYGSFAAGIGAPIIYHALESSNLIPSQISILVEKYMPTLVNASMIATGGIFSKVIALGTLSSSLPGASDYVQKKIETIFLSNIRGTTLKEIDASWLENVLSFDEILYVLENEKDYLYEINPAHCSKPADVQLSFPKDYEFKKFLELFDQVKWKERYSVLKPAFRDDDRFQRKLKKKFGEQDFELCIEKWAAETNVSKEEFLAARLNQQINDFVSILCKEKAVKGSALDLEDAIESCSSIMGYLNNTPLDVGVEDILSKLAIEAGKYCARGIKRAAAEIHSGLILEDPSYVRAIHAKLQNIRQQIMQNTYLKIVENMVKIAKEGKGAYVSTARQTTDVHAVAIAQDVHTMDLYGRYLALGFIPLTENERSLFGVADFISWSLYRPIRKEMYQHYQSHLNQAIIDHGEIHFVDYMVNKIKELPIKLSEIEILMDKFSDDGEKTIQSFHRLFFVMQGILKVKPVYTDWVEVEHPEPLISEDAFEKELSEWEMTV